MPSGLLSSNPAVISHGDKADNEDAQGEQHLSHWFRGSHTSACPQRDIPHHQKLIAGLKIEFTLGPTSPPNSTTNYTVRKYQH